MDERERPPYLGDLPRDRRGNWPMYLLAVGLLAALIGAWKVYTGTVVAWHERFQAPKPTATAPAPPSPAELERRRAALQEALVAEAARQIMQQAEKQDRSGWKCIDGTPFRPVPGGGWENVPGEWCMSERNRNRR